jgi:hypothetical protein
MATAQDAELILHLYEARREAVLRQAREWFVQHFNPKTVAEFRDLMAPGTDSNRYVRMVTSYWEMAASFLLRGAVDEDLFLDNCGECLLVWRKISGIVAELRAERGQPGYLRSIEEVSRRAEARRARVAAQG